MNTNRLPLSLLFCFLLSNCASPRNTVTPAQSVTLNVLRFDNHGKLTSDSDLEGLRKKIAATPQTVVVFMHGWKGSAAPTDHNVQSFNDALAKVRARTYKDSGRKLTGVYLTWNAHHLPGLAEYPMYYATEGRADAVAQGEGIATTIKVLSGAMQHRGREHLIVAGHSFGGRILGRVVGNHPELLRDVDLWILANAADDSSACLKTIDAVNAHPYQRGRLPKLVWVTSARDSMTGTLFKIAERKKAIGHDRELQSYEVKINEPSQAHHAYSAEIERVSRRTGAYVHNLSVEKGLGGHGDVWSEPMIQIVDYYVVHNLR